MARADLLKKLFSSYKKDDKEMFYSVALEIIEDEEKKNHGILADDLRLILSGNYHTKKTTMTSFNTPKDEDKDMPLVEIMYPEKFFSDLIVSEEKICQLQQIIKEFNNWEVLVSNGVFPIRRVLFYGPPGCGKTLAAQTLAGELGIPMLYVRFDALISSYLGETASNIRKVFDYAKHDSWLIFFDEFDAIARSRDDVTEHGEIKRVVNAFLQQIDNYKGRSLIIAATNFEKSLDYAIWRRFDETICFNMPTNEEKIKLFKLKLNKLKGPIHVAEEYLSNMKDFSHSDVEKSCQSVMKHCILEGKKIYTKHDIEYSIMKQEKNVALRKTQY